MTRVCVLIRLCIAVIGAVISTSPVGAQSLKKMFERATRVPTVSASDMYAELSSIKRATATGLPPPYVVAGRREFQGSTLVAEEIVLRPGSTLVLVPNADQEKLFITAQKITVEPGSPSPIITWQREDAPSAQPPPSGKAQPGSPGLADGAPGERGRDGAIGNPGFRGESAPTLYLTVSEIVGGGELFVDLRGQDGGPGGVGQEGGNGGSGARGRPASTSLFDCKRGGGRGGDGGAGGNGGPGGSGGAGGDGGTFVLMAHQNAIEQLATKIQIDVSGGKGGSGGPGGAAGIGGLSGQGGNGDGLCGGGARGEEGNGGEKGAENKNLGPAGAAGRAVQIPLSGSNVDGIGLKVVE